MLAFLLLGQDCSLEFSDLQQRVTEGVSGVVELTELSQPTIRLIFRRGDYVLSVMMVDQPLPESPSDAIFGKSMSWTDARQAIDRHKAHLSLGVAGGNSGRERALILQDLIAAAASACPEPLGVYYTNAETLWPAELFVRDPKVTPAVLVPAFVSLDVSVATGKDAFDVTTTGLVDFGLMEIETTGYVGPSQALGKLVYGFADYLIESGPVVKDGDTAGPDAASKFTVDHVKSSSGSGQPVYRLEFTSPAKRSWLQSLFGK